MHIQYAVYIPCGLPCGSLVDHHVDYCVGYSDFSRYADLSDIYKFIETDSAVNCFQLISIQSCTKNANIVNFEHYRKTSWWQHCQNGLNSC